MTDLGAVGEVAELRLPEHEGVGALDRVAVLERHRRVLAEQRVVDPEPAPGSRLRFASGSHSWPFDAVVQHGVALHERAAAGVLAGQAHRRALEQQRAEGEQLAEAPSRSPPLRLMSRRFSSSCCSFGCTVKPVGLVVERVADELRRRLGRHAGGLGLADASSAATRALEVVAARRTMTGIAPVCGGVRLGERALEAVLEVLLCACLVLLLGDVAAADERLGVEACAPSAWPR